VSIVQNGGELKEYAYHQWSVADVEKHFETDIKKGLSDEKVTSRLKSDGHNSLQKLKDVSPFSILIRQFANFFIAILFVAAVISYYVDGLNQALILVVIIAINVSLGFFQEYKAEKALSELKNNFKIKTKVWRDNKIDTINSEEIVRGDIVLLEAGDRIPADLRLVEEESLRVNESALTGESLPISKSINVLPLETPMADRRDILFASTVVAAGRGRGIVVATGADTEFGKIAEMIEKPEETTPLEKQVNYLGKVLSIIFIITAGLIFLLGVLRNFEVLPMLTFSIALLVAAVPESLPTAITLALAIGVSRMAAKKAIVRRMAVIETLGTTDIIATDKTGTLTDNNLIVDRIILADKGKLIEYELSDNTKNDAISDFFAHGLACSNVNLNEEGEYLGDPVEVAIIEKADKIDNLARYKAKKFERLTEVPFDSDKKYMAVVAKSAGGKWLIAKGMTEKIVNFCKLSGAAKRKVLSKAEELSKAGFKVIALADKQISAKHSDALNEMRFEGLFAMVDEPSEGIKKAVAAVIAAGIRPLIITGDHPETARFVANKIGLNVAPYEMIVEKEFRRMSDAELLKACRKVKVFARVTPEDKIKIVAILQKAGYSVAMIGDGVNDAPALKEAQVGVAMGIKGTDVAKDSADIILSDDRYGTIVSAVEYGRTIFDNIRNVITFLLTGNLNEILLVGFAFVLGLPLPLSTIQILWINMVTDSMPALALSLEKPTARVLGDKPRPSIGNSLKGSLVYSGYLSLVSFIMCLSVYLWGLSYSVQKAQTLTFTFFVLIQLLYCLSIRSKKRIWEDVGSFFENQLLVISVLVSIVLQFLIFSEPLATVFRVVPLKISEIMFLTIMLAVSFVLAEIVRALHDKKTHKV